MDWKKEINKKLAEFKRSGNKNPVVVVGVSMKASLSEAMSEGPEFTEEDIIKYTIPIKYVEDEPDAFYITIADGSQVNTPHLEQEFY